MVSERSIGRHAETKDHRRMITFITAFLLARGDFPRRGIESQYKADRAIEKDPRVVFVENFETESLEEIWKRWETVGDKPGQTLTPDVPPGSFGAKSLLMDRTKGPGPQLYRRLKNKDGTWGYDRLFG